MGSTEHQLMTVAEVAAELRISRAQLYRLIEAGAFPSPLKISSRSLWARATVQAWIGALIANGSVGPVSP